MFIIIAPHIKTHIASTQEITDKVVANLCRRFKVDMNEIKVEKTQDSCFLWDRSVGMIINNDVKLEFLFNDFKIVCRSQHWQQFKGYVYKQLSNQEKYDDCFYKLHSNMSVLCLSEEDKMWLVLQMKKEEKVNDQICFEKSKIVQDGDIDSRLELLRHNIYST